MNLRKVDAANSFAEPVPAVMDSRRILFHRGVVTQTKTATSLAARAVHLDAVPTAISSTLASPPSLIIHKRDRTADNTKERGSVDGRSEPNGAARRVMAVLS